ncbi:type II toxin-antitoxin system HigA family antitoxin [Acaryochloris sp. CCMEE 5410]|uniref:helix-turn-helix domain-containing protein n=1 Tax=Acaryochloris sp. CCMEE 5410 TaxID=310037 RepID=UPI0002483DEF|nr:transcriptional regulator [Acaryochloris sp. CCMEE 5410]KAI9135629.1 transcriptional regulator [Acaryochloris sp. CCMEE 5410]
MILGTNNAATYESLIQEFIPRPIHNDQQLEAVQMRIDALIDLERELTPDETDYLDLLGTLVWEYEQSLEALPDIYGVELLKVLVEDRGLRQKDLVPIFKAESIISDIFKGRRQLTTRHIQELAAYFSVSPAVFFPLTP